MASWMCSAKRDHVVMLLGSRLHGIYMGDLIRADPRVGTTWLHLNQRTNWSRSSPVVWGP